MPELTRKFYGGEFDRPGAQDAGDFTKALAVTAVLCVACVAGSIPLFNKKAL